jgi:hypothetical protein
MATRPNSKAALRAAIAVVAVYALVLNALFSASVAFVPSSFAGVSICGHDGTASDQPDLPRPAHDEPCCVAACGMTAAVLPPDASEIFVWSSRTGKVVTPLIAAFAPSPPPNSQASPRGPPSRI